MRRFVVTLVVVGLGAFVALRGSGPVGVILWEVIVTAAFFLVVWRRWPRRPEPVPALLGEASAFDRRPLGHLATLELEVVAATDAALGGELRLRRRLRSLAEHRAGLTPGSLSDDSGPAVLGEGAWGILTGTGPMRPRDVASLVKQIEDP
jgi:hypothetical protein